MDDHRYFSSDTNRRTETTSMENEYVKPASHKRAVVLGVVNTAGMKSANVNRKRRWDQPPEELESSSKKVCVIETETLLKNEIESPSTLSDTTIDNNSELSANSSGSVKLSDRYNDNLTVKYNSLSDSKNPEPSATLKQLEADTITSEGVKSTVSRIITPEQTVQISVVSEDSDAMLVDETINVNSSDLCKDSIHGDGDSGMVFSHVSTKAPSSIASKCETKETHTVEARTFVSSMSDSLKQIQFYDGGDSNTDSEDFDKLNEADASRNSGTSHDVDMSSKDRVINIETTCSVNDNKICTSEEERKNQFSLNIKSVEESIDENVNSIVNSNSVNISYRGNKSELMQSGGESEVHSLLSKESNNDGLLPVQNETEVSKTLEAQHCLNINLSDIPVSENIDDRNLELNVPKNICQNENKTDLSVSGLKNSQIIEEFEYKEYENRLLSQEKMLSDTLLPDVDSQKQNTLPTSLNPAETSSRTPPAELMATTSKLKKTGDSFYLLESSNHISNADILIEAKEINESKDDEISSKTANKLVDKNKIEEEPDVKLEPSSSLSTIQSVVCNEDNTLKEKDTSNFKAENVAVISEESEVGEASIMATNSKGLEDIEHHEFVDSAKISQEVKNMDIINNLKVTERCVESAEINPIIGTLTKSPTVGQVDVIFQNSTKPSLDRASHDVSLSDIPLPVTACSSAYSAEVSEGPESKISIEKNAVENVHNSPEVEDLKKLMKEYSSTEPIVGKDLEGESRITEKLEDEKKVLDIEKSMGTSIISITKSAVSEVFVDLREVPEKVETSIEVTSATNIDPVVMEVIFGPNDKASVSDDSEVIPYNALSSVDSDDEVVMKKQDAGSHHPDNEGLIEGEIVTDDCKSVLDSKQGEKLYSYNKHDRDIQIQNSEILLDSAEIVTVDPNKPLIEESPLISDTSNDSDTGRGDNNLMTEIDNYIDGSELDKTSPFDVKSYKISSDESNDGESKTTYETAKTISDDQDKEDSDNIEVKRDPSNNCELSKEETEETMESVYFDANQKDEVSDSEDPLEGAETRCETITNLFETHKLEEEQNLEDFLDKEGENEKDANQICAIRAHNLIGDYRKEVALNEQQELMDVCNKEDDQNKSLEIVSNVVEEMEINFEGDIPLESCDKGMNQLEEEREIAAKSVIYDIELNPENVRNSKDTLNDEMKTLVHVEDGTNYLQEDGTPREVKDIDVSQIIKDLDNEASTEVVNCSTAPNQSEATNVIENSPHQSISISNERDECELEQEKHEIGEQQIDNVQALGETEALNLKPKSMGDNTQEIGDVKEVNESEEMEISLAVETIQRCEVSEITKKKEAVGLTPLTDELLVTGSTFPPVEKKEYVEKEDQGQEIISTIELECVEESQEENSKPVQETEDSLAVKSIIERSDEEFTNDQMDLDDNLELETDALKQREEIDAAERDRYQKKIEDSLEMECTSLLEEVEYEIDKEIHKEKVRESLEKAEVSDTHKIECPTKDEDTSHSQNVKDISEIVKMEESKTLDNCNKIKISIEPQLIENILSVKVAEQAPAENDSNKCQVLEISERKLNIESDTVIIQVTSEPQKKESKPIVEQEKEVRFATQTFPLNQEVEFLKKEKKEDSKQQKDDVLAVEDGCNTEKLIVPEKEGLEQKVFDILTMISNTEKSGTPDIQLSSKSETRTNDSQDIPISEKSTVIEPAIEKKNKKEAANQEAPDSSSEQIHFLREPNKLSAVREQYISELSVPEVAEILEETTEQQKEISEPTTEDSNNKDNTPITPEDKMAMENSCHTFKKDGDFSKIYAQASQDVETGSGAFTDNLQDNENSSSLRKIIKEEFILEDPVTDKVKQLQQSNSEKKEILKEDDIKKSPKQTRTEDVSKFECVVVREEIIPSKHLTAEAFGAVDCTQSIISEATNKSVEELPEEIIADDIIESIRVKDDSEVVIETEVMDSISGDVSNENQEVMEIGEPSDELKQSQKNEINTHIDDDDDDDDSPPPAALDENSDSVQIVEDACTESKPNEKYQYYKERSEEMSVDGQAIPKNSRVVCKENVENTVLEKDKLEEKGITLLSINVDQNVHNMGERLKSDGRDVAIVPLLTTITNENQQKSEEASKRVHLHSIAPCSDEPQKQQPLSPLQKLEPITLRIYKDNLTVRTDGLDSPKKHRSPILSGELKTQLSPHLKGSPNRSSLSPQNKQLEFTLKIAKDANTNFPKATMSPKSNMSPSGSVWKTDVSSPVVNKESQSPSHGSPTSESTLNRLKLKICKPNESTEILTHSNVGFSSNSLETNPTIPANCTDSSPSESTRGINTQCSQMEEFRTPKSHLKLETMFKKMLETRENISLSSSSINSTVQPDMGVVASECAPQPPPPAPIIPTPRKRGRPRKIVPTIPRLPTDPNNPLLHSFTVPDSSSAMSADGGVNTNRPMRSCRGRTKPIVIATRKPRGGGMMRGGGRGRGILRITPDRETLTEYEKAELAKIEERKERLRAESIARYEAKKAKKLAKKLKDEERRKRLARERAEKAEAAAPQVFEEETRMSASDSSYSRGHTPATFRSNQALASLRKDGSKIEPREQALEAVAAWNANLNRERKEERRCALDLQTFTIHYPQSDRETMTRPVPKVGLYPIALIPGQFCDYYKQYTPTELMYFPLNTVLYGPLKPNERHQGNGSDDGSGSDSDTSSTDDSSDSSTESSDTSDEQEEAKCKICKTIKRDSKDSQVEILIQCAQCKTTSHPSCQDFTDEMLPHIKKYDWVCTDCKQCLTCKTRGNVEKILCCDLCDRGHHVECLGLKKVPERWHCSVCSYCSNCGTRDPGGPDWQHEYKKDEKGMKVYQRTLCASCCKNALM